MPSCWSISTGRCVSAGASRRPRRAPTRRGRSAAFCTSTSGRRRSPSGRSRRRSRATTSWPRTASTHTTWRGRATRAGRWRSSTARRPAASAAGVARCISSTPATASSGAGRSWAATCRSPPAWRSRPGIAMSATSRSASSVTAPQTWAPSTRASRSRRSGSCRSSSSARTTSMRWGRRSTARWRSRTSPCGRAGTIEKRS